LSERFRSLSGAGETPAEKVAARLGVRVIFSADLTAQLAGQVRRSYEVVSRGGARQVVEEML
tara:strand:+ start:4430 stop:4615 length:186 start_codon:yes stop_codon:yes gene_type:complete